MSKSSNGHSQAAISMQPLTFDSLISHCKDAKEEQTLRAAVSTLLHKAADSIKQKIEKCKPHLCKSIIEISLFLEPRVRTCSEYALEDRVKLRNYLDLIYPKGQFESVDNLSQLLSLMQQMNLFYLSTQHKFNRPISLILVGLILTVKATTKFTYRLATA